MTTLYVTHSQYAEHKMQDQQHPEHPGRIQAVWELFKEANLTERLQIGTPDTVTDEQILRVHTQKRIRGIFTNSKTTNIVRRRHESV